MELSRKVLQRAISMLTKSDLKYGNNIPEWLKDEYSYWEKLFLIRISLATLELSLRKKAI